MKLKVLADADTVASQAPAIIAAEARTAAAARVRFLVAVSGGHTLWLMLRALAGEEPLLPPDAGQRSAEFAAGDDFLRTQRGNNNAYNQDNETSWLDRSRIERHADHFRFAKRMIAFRKSHPSLGRALLAR